MNCCHEGKPTLIDKPAPANKMTRRSAIALTSSPGMGYCKFSTRDRSRSSRITRQTEPGCGRLRLLRQTFDRVEPQRCSDALALFFQRLHLRVRTPGLSVSHAVECHDDEAFWGLAGEAHDLAAACKIFPAVRLSGGRQLCDDRAVGLRICDA